MKGVERVAVVTGGGRGIGRGIVMELASSGHSLAINFRSNLASASATAREAIALGAPRVELIQGDVADLSAGSRMVSQVRDQFGRIDLWVNNAGIAPITRADVLETSPESWDRVLTTNLRGPFFLTQHVAKTMLEFQSQRIVDEPQIIFITSVSSQFLSLNRAEYCVSKAGLSMVAGLFALRLACTGIRVYEVRPGIISTDMTGPVRELYDRRIADGLSPIRRWGTPEDVGKAVAALASGALPFSTGEVIHVGGGLHLPRL